MEFVLEQPFNKNIEKKMTEKIKNVHDLALFKEDSQ